MARGHKQKLGENRYRLYVPTGERYKESNAPKYKTKVVRCSSREADTILARMVAQTAAGEPLPAKKMTTGEYLAAWMNDLDYLVSLGSLRPETANWYKGKVKTHLIPSFGGVPLHRLSHTHLEDCYVRARENRTRKRKSDVGGVTPSTIAGIHRTIRAAFNAAPRLKIALPPNVLDAVRLANRPTVPKKAPRILSLEECVKLLQAAAGTRMYGIILTAMATTMRRREILGLRWADINFDTGEIVCQWQLDESLNPPFAPIKTAATAGPKRIRMIPFLIDELQRIKAEQAYHKATLGKRYHDLDLVFCQQDGKHLWPENIGGREFARVLTKAKLPHIKFHALRHGTLSNLSNAGIDLRVLQAIAGHSRIETTVGYTQSSTAAQAAAIEVLNQALQKAKKDQPL